MYKNEYLMDKKLIHEYVFNTMSKYLIIISFFIFSFSIIFFFIDNTYLRFVLLTCGLLSILCSCSSFFLTCYSISKTIEKKNNNSINKIIVIFNDKITIDDGSVKSNVEYDDIVKIKETNNFIMLKLKNDSYVLVLKTGFIKGTKEEFLSFINSKI